MKRTKISLVILGVIGALGMTLAGPAAREQQEKPEKAQKTFDGKVEAVDATARTFGPKEKAEEPKNEEPK